MVNKELFDMSHSPLFWIKPIKDRPFCIGLLGQSSRAGPDAARSGINNWLCKLSTNAAQALLLQLLDVCPPGLPAFGLLRSVRQWMACNGEGTVRIIFMLMLALALGSAYLIIASGTTFSILMVARALFFIILTFSALWLLAGWASSRLRSR
jgi:hypothetical protein